MRIKSFLAIAALTCFALVSFGCGGGATNTASNANAKPANTATTSTTTSTGSTTTTSTNTADTAKTAPAADAIGVPECDEYIKKYEACLAKVAAKNPQVEAQFKTSFETLRNSWKTAASTPQGKAGLAAGCKQALDTAKQSMAAYSCEW